MKKNMLIIFIMLFSTLTIQAQLGVNEEASPANADGSEFPGKLITQLAGAIKPNALVGPFIGEKAAFLDTAGKVSNAAGMAKQASALIKNIKPDQFKNNLNQASLIKLASAVTTMEKASDLLKKLENYIKPEAFSNIWALQRSGWLSDLSKIAKPGK
jgi:hypothetical protein